MNNNVGVISEPIRLLRTIGGTLDITDPSLINSITGEIDIGFIAFDSDGTMGVCTNFSRDENGNPIFTFRTMSLNTEIDIISFLSQKY